MGTFFGNGALRVISHCKLDIIIIIITSLVSRYTNNDNDWLTHSGALHALVVIVIKLLLCIVRCPGKC